MKAKSNSNNADFNLKLNFKWQQWQNNGEIQLLTLPCFSGNDVQAIMEFYYDDEMGNFVCPVVDAPGYFYEWVEPIGDWVMKYKPIAGYYSPPVFDTNLSWYQISVPKGISIGALKGNGALHFEDPFVSLPFKDSADGWYEHWSGAAYIFYREDANKIEVWSSDLPKTLIRVVGWLEAVQSFVKTLPKNRTLKKLS